MIREGHAAVCRTLRIWREVGCCWLTSASRFVHHCQSLALTHCCHALAMGGHQAIPRSVRLSVCSSLGYSTLAAWRSCLGMLAACSWPATRDVWTVDPSADGRRSAVSWTAIGAGAITCNLLMCVYDSSVWCTVLYQFAGRTSYAKPSREHKIVVVAVRMTHFGISNKNICFLLYKEICFVL